jgi:hypothetical protein
MKGKDMEADYFFDNDEKPKPLKKKKGTVSTVVSPEGEPVKNEVKREPKPRPAAVRKVGHPVKDRIAELIEKGTYRMFIPSALNTEVEEIFYRLKIAEPDEAKHMNILQKAEALILSGEKDYISGAIMKVTKCDRWL